MPDAEPSFFAPTQTAPFTHASAQAKHCSACDAEPSLVACCCNAVLHESTGFYVMESWHVLILLVLVASINNLARIQCSLQVGQAVTP